MNMKDKFPGYYPPTGQEEKSLWDEGIFVFDTCSLLNLYSYSNGTRDELLGVLNKIKDRLWMPFQVASELHKNRVMRIGQERKNYADTIQSIDKFRKDIDERHRSKRQHPFISEEAFGTLNESLDLVQKEMEQCRENLDGQLFEDPLFDKLCDLFGSNVGEAFSDERHAEICVEGKKRYKVKCPPGYMDGDAGGNDAKPEPDRYGDLILWRETIEHAQREKKPIVLITDDNKEDWWRFSPIDKRKSLGPRMELISEFQNESQQKCWIYNSETFVRRANDLIDEVSTEAQSEVKNVARSARSGLSKSFVLPNFESQLVKSIAKTQEDQEAFASALALAMKPTISAEAFKLMTPSVSFESVAQQVMRDALAREEMIEAVKANALAFYDGHGEEPDDNEDMPETDEPSDDQ